MDVEVTIDAAKHPRTAWPYRLVELVGLLMLLYGLASSEWLIAMAGALVIVMTYQVYRRRHPARPDRGDGGGSSGGNDPVDFGGDGGGGD